MINETTLATIINKYAGFGYAFYYLYQKDVLSISDITTLLLKSSLEQAQLRFQKFLSLLSNEVMEESFKEASLSYPEEEVFQECIGLSQGALRLKEDKYDTILNYIYTKKTIDLLSQATYKRKVNFYYQYIDELLKQMKESICCNV